MAAPYTSFIQQINDAQDPQTGADQDCVPWCGRGGSGARVTSCRYGHGGEPADPAWGCAYTFLIYDMYKFYGDTRVVAQHYAGLRAYLEFLSTDCGYSQEYCVFSARNAATHHPQSARRPSTATGARRTVRVSGADGCADGVQAAARPDPACCRRLSSYRSTR